MKRLFYFLSLLIIGIPLVYSQGSSIRVVKVFDNVSMLVDTTNTSAAIDLQGYKPLNFTYSLQVLVTNSTSTNVCGDAQIIYEVSNDNKDYLLSSNIVSKISYTNSPTSGGKGFYVFSPGISRYIRIRAISTTTNLFLNGWLAIQ